MTSIRTYMNAHSLLSLSVLSLSLSSLCPLSLSPLSLSHTHSHPHTHTQLTTDVYLTAMVVGKEGLYRPHQPPGQVSSQPWLLEQEGTELIQCVEEALLLIFLFGSC